MRLRDFEFSLTGAPSPSAGTSARASSSPVVLAALGALAIASSAIFIRLADASPVTAAVFRTLYALPALALLALLERRRHGPNHQLRGRAALASGVFFAAGLICWHHAILAVGAGIGTVLPNVQVIFVPLIGWALFGERPSRALVTAIPLVLLGFVLVSGALDPHAYGDHPLLGVMFGLLTALAYAGFLLTFHRACPDKQRIATPLLTFTASATAVAAAVGLSTGELDLTPGWHASAWLIAVALVSQVGGWFLISTAMPQLPVAQTSIVLALQPVAAIVLALAFLAETPSPLQLAGMSAIVLAVLVATHPPITQALRLRVRRSRDLCCDRGRCSAAACAGCA